METGCEVAGFTIGWPVGCSGNAEAVQVADERETHVMFACERCRKRMVGEGWSVEPGRTRPCMNRECAAAVTPPAKWCDRECRDIWLTQVMPKGTA